MRSILLIGFFSFTALSAQVVDHSKLTPEERSRFIPLIERYLLDEIKLVRQDMQHLRAELIEKVVEKELRVANQAMAYSTDTITYFFFMVTGIASLLALVGWHSLREVKDNARLIAERQLGRLTEEYEERLTKLEKELRDKSDAILANQLEIEKTQRTHSFWFQAAQEPDWQKKIDIYDQILKLDPGNHEAMAYKADAALALGENEWAFSICNQILRDNPENSLALFHRGRANVGIGKNQDGVEDLQKAVELSESFREQIRNQIDLHPLEDDEKFQQLKQEIEST